MLTYPTNLTCGTNCIAILCILIEHVALEHGHQSIGTIFSSSLSCSDVELTTLQPCCCTPMTKWDSECNLRLQRSQFCFRIRECWNGAASHFSMLSGSIKSEVYHRFKAAEKLAKFCTGYNVTSYQIWPNFGSVCRIFLCVFFFQDVLSFRLKKDHCGAAIRWHAITPTPVQSSPIVATLIGLSLFPVYASISSYFYSLTPFYEVSSAGLHLSRPNGNHPLSQHLWAFLDW